MEVSSHALDQHRVDGTQFAAACFTNLTHDHLDYHGTIDAYFEAKARLFTRGFARARRGQRRRPVRRVLARPGSRRRARRVRPTRSTTDGRRRRRRDVVLGADGTRFDARHCAAATASADRVDDRCVGPFNVANVLAAAATALRRRASRFDAVVAGLGRRSVVPGRFERVDAAADFAVLVDYAHTPDALERCWRRPARSPDRRQVVVVVFGCGGDRDRAKRPLMGAVAAAARRRRVPHLRQPAFRGPRRDRGRRARRRRRPIATAGGRARPPRARSAPRSPTRDAGDVVVIAGKGHETGQTVGGVTTSRSTTAIVAREELEACACD